ASCNLPSRQNEFCDDRHIFSGAGCVMSCQGCGEICSRSDESAPDFNEFRRNVPEPIRAMSRPMEKSSKLAQHAKGLKESAMAGSRKTTSQTNNRGGGLAREFANFLRAIKALADPYRPELHYMRGPGPKYHAKHNPHREAVDNHPGLASANG